MTDLKTDEEKAEDIKRWWKENGTSVVTGVALAIAGVFGWQQWQAHKVEQAENASALFAQQQNAFSEAQLAEVKDSAGSTPYASLAALNAAKNAAKQGNNEQAISELQWVVDNTPDELIKEVATLQLARMEISTKQFDAAKARLNQTFSTAYATLVEELKGDLYFAQDQLKEAAAAYKQAIQLSGGNAPRYLQMKLDSIGEGA